VLLVLLCALGGVLLFSRADHRTEVLVAAGDLEAGEPITRGDLRIERITVDGDIRSLSPADAGALVGLLPVGRIPAGTLLARGMFADEVPLAADEIVFGAALDPGEAPLSGVQVGAPVEQLATGQLWISMRVPRDVGLAASEASQRDTLRVVLIGGGP
jgi:hypothetical protein